MIDGKKEGLSAPNSRTDWAKGVSGVARLSTMETRLQRDRSIIACKGFRVTPELQQDKSVSRKSVGVLRLQRHGAVVIRQRRLVFAELGLRRRQDVQRVERIGFDRKDLPADLRRFSGMGEWEVKDKEASAKLKDLPSRRVFLRQVEAGWVLEDRQK